MRWMITCLFLFFSLSLLTAQSVMEGFDVDGSWTCAGSCTSYSDHTYTANGVDYNGIKVLRQSDSDQDGFPGALGTYAWRLRDESGSSWTATIASGGVSNFSLYVRRWDDNPEVDYDLEYSIDGGTNWTLVENITNEDLNNASDWVQITGIINSSNMGIMIRVSRNSGERLMIDDFAYSPFSSSCPVQITNMNTSCNINEDPATWSASIDFIGGNNSVDYTLTTTAGTISDPDILDENETGTIVINDIPAGQDITVTITNTNDDCDINYLISAPDCSCSITEISVTDAYCNTNDEFVLNFNVTGQNYGDLEISLDDMTYESLSSNEYIISNPSNQSGATLYIRSANKTSCGASTTFNMFACPQPYISEFHYDNAGGDIEEFIEVYSSVPLGGLAGSYSVLLYNGSNGAQYGTFTLSDATKSSDGTGYYYVIYPTSIQNGNPDGMALCFDGNPIEFLSYGGTFTASGLCADGLTSTDVGVSQGSGTPVGSSIYKDTDGNWRTTEEATPGMAFPVDLTHFTVTARDKTAHLTWATASEVDNDYFLVEKSLDGKSFDAIGKVAGHGTTTREQQYSYEDHELYPMNYYRLKQVDYDGAHEYSKVITLEKSIGEDVHIINRTVRQSLQIDNGVTGQVTYTVLDLNGRTLSTGTLAPALNNIDVSSVPSGLFIVSIASAGQVISEKIRKL